MVLIVGGRIRRHRHGPPASCAVARASTSASSSRRNITTISPAGPWSAPAFFTPERTPAPHRGPDPPGRPVGAGCAVAAFDPVHDRVELTDGRWIGYLHAGRSAGAEAGLGRDSGPGGNARAQQRHLQLRLREPHPTPGSWCRRCAAAGRSSPSRPCRSNAPAPRRRPCICRPTTGADNGRNDIEIEIPQRWPGAVLGVKDYVPALMEYVRKYRIDLNFGSRLVAVDGPARIATFAVTGADGEGAPGAAASSTSCTSVRRRPRRTSFAKVRWPPKAAGSRWTSASLRHKRFEERLRPGRCLLRPQRQDRCGRPQTGARRGRERPVAAGTASRCGRSMTATAHVRSRSSAARSCWPSSAMAASSLPSFPKWMLDGTKPTRLAWHLKAQALPEIYWLGMLRGREWPGRPPPTSNPPPSFALLSPEPDSWTCLRCSTASAPAPARSSASPSGLVGAGGGSILAVPLIVYLVGGQGAASGDRHQRLRRGRQRLRQCDQSCPPRHGEMEKSPVCSRVAGGARSLFWVRAWARPWTVRSCWPCSPS